MKIPEWDLFLGDGYKNVRLSLKREHYVSDDVQFNSPNVIVDFCNKNLYLGSQAEEHVYLIALGSNKILGISELSHGDANRASCRPREMFARLLLMGAIHFVIVHNHPIGDPQPSKADKSILRQVAELSYMMCVSMLDFIIVSGEQFFSADMNGLMKEALESFKHQKFDEDEEEEAVDLKPDEKKPEKEAS